MKKGNPLTSLSPLVGGMLLILAAFPRGHISQMLLLTLFGIWLAAFLIPRGILLWSKSVKEKAAFHRRRAQADEDSPDTVSELLLEHVQARITEHLRQVYPDATWEFCEKAPMEDILDGGMVRIRLKGAGEFTQGTVSFEDPQTLEIDLIRTEKLHRIGTVCIPSAHEGPEELILVPEVEDTSGTPTEAPVDVSVWYSLIGRDALTNLITDLNVRGCSSLQITEDGDVLIQQDNSEQKERTLDRMPKSDFWPELIGLIEEQGLTVKSENKRLAIAW